MTNTAQAAAKRRVRALVESVRSSRSVDAFLRTLTREGEAYIFGGAVRDAILGAPGLSSDVDIVVSGALSEIALEGHTRKIGRTRFGGFRLVVGNQDFDVWRLDESAVFAEVPSMVSVSALLRSVVFSSDGVAVALTTGKIHWSEAFKKTLGSRLLYFVNAPESRDSMTTVRALRLMLKLSLKPSPELANYLRDAMASGLDEHLINAEAKWSGRRLLDRASINILRQRLTEGL